MPLHLLCIVSCHHFMVTLKDGWRVPTCPSGTKRRLTWSKAGLQCHDLSPLLYHQTTECTQIDENKVNEKKHGSSCPKWKKAKLKGLMLVYRHFPFVGFFVFTLLTFILTTKIRNLFSKGYLAKRQHNLKTWIQHNVNLPDKQKYGWYLTLWKWDWRFTILIFR